VVAEGLERRKEIREMLNLKIIIDKITDGLDVGIGRRGSRDVLEFFLEQLGMPFSEKENTGQRPDFCLFKEGPLAMLSLKFQTDI